MRSHGVVNIQCLWQWGAPLKRPCSCLVFVKVDAWVAWVLERGRYTSHHRELYSIVTMGVGMCWFRTVVAISCVKQLNALLDLSHWSDKFRSIPQLEHHRNAPRNSVLRPLCKEYGVPLGSPKCHLRVTVWDYSYFSCLQIRPILHVWWLWGSIGLTPSLQPRRTTVGVDS